MRAMENSSPAAGGMSLGGGPLPALLGPRVHGAVLCISSRSGFWPDSQDSQGCGWPRAGLKALLLKVAGPHLSSPLPPGSPRTPVDLTMTFTTLASQSPELLPPTPDS